MSEEIALAAFETIIRNTELTPSGQIIYNGEVCATLTSAQPKPGEWQNALQNVLYTHCYCTGLEVLDGSAPNSVDETAADTFVAALQAANCTQEGWEMGWQVEAVDTYGVVWAGKGSESRSLHSGEFTVESPWDIPVKAGNFVLAKMFKEMLAADNAFYYVYSQTLPDKEEINLVRFYWNLEAPGAPILIKEITTRLNQFGLPFQFKCLRHPGMYQRADAAVLYLSKRYVAVAAQLINQFYPLLKPYLKKAVPLFCKKLGTGLGFAENPGNGESFGMNRSRLLAQGLALAQLHKKGVAETLDEVVAVFKTNGYSLAHLYRNPDAHYPYALPTLD
ncbi:MAG: hypothetical protein JWQ14_1563 [Adhaeribacter sp.]|jgi:hypothetical protein|nr:hypothetical protein [Adhaeribacter sp.]